MAPDVAATIRTAPAAAPDSGNAPPPDASLAPPLAEPEKLPEKANTPLAAPRLSTLPVATAVNGTTPVAMPAVLTAPAASPENGIPPAPMAETVTDPVAAPVRARLPPAAPIRLPPSAPTTASPASRGTRLRSMSGSDQGRAVAERMVGGKVGIKAPLPSEVSFNGSAISQGWFDKCTHHLCDFSSPGRASPASVISNPNRGPAGSRCHIVHPQKGRCNCGQRNIGRRLIAIQKNQTIKKPAVCGPCEKNVIKPGEVV